MPFLNRFPGARPEHEIYKLFNDNPNKNFACRVCGCTWQRKPNHGKCTGVKVYEKWSDVPSGLFSATAIYRDHKRKLPDDVLPIAAVRHESSSFTPIYSLEQGDPNYKGKKKKPVTKSAVVPASSEPQNEVPKKPGPFDWLQKPEGGK